MRTFNLFICLMVVGAMGVVGCSTNPEPPSGNLPLSVAPVPNKTVINYPVPGPLTILPPSGIGLQDAMSFSVGTAGTFTVTVWVPSPGTPVVTFAGLPAGAVYSSSDPGTLTWTPAANDATDPADPTSHTRVYQVTLNLASSADSTYVRSRDFVVIVRKPVTSHDAMDRDEFAPAQSEGVDP